MNIDPRDPRNASEQERAQRSLPFKRTRDQTARARDLREKSTPPEGLLWSRLRARRLNGLKFRRQHPVGPCTADFYCHEVRVVVEADGAVHSLRRDRDEARDAWFARNDIRTVRVSASLMARDLGAALETIARVCEERRAEIGARDGPERPARAGTDRGTSGGGEGRRK